MLVVARLAMLSAIAFDDDASLDAREIHDVRRDRELPPEARPEPMPTKFAPQRALGICQVRTQRARTLLDGDTAAHIGLAGPQITPSLTLPRKRGRGFA